MVDLRADSVHTGAPCDGSETERLDLPRKRVRYSTAVHAPSTIGLTEQMAAAGIVVVLFEPTSLRTMSSRPAEPTVSWARGAVTAPVARTLKLFLGMVGSVGVRRAGEERVGDNCCARGGEERRRLGSVQPGIGTGEVMPRHVKSESHRAHLGCSSLSPFWCGPT